jgi:NAD(P)-dependent dehydrogenase (short-subunit alcohol dehydrogenase family)
VAIVTGGGRGIGRAVALELARRGADVAVIARTGTEVESVAREVSALGRRSLAVAGDLAGGGAVDSAVAQVERSLGSVLVLVNSAGVAGPFGPTWETDPADWERALRVNLTVPYLMCRAVLPAMLAARWGRIVNVSSIVAVRPPARLGAYPASKAALDAFTRQLAAEVDGTGVSVCAVYPGVTDTAMHETIRAQPPSLVGAEFSRRFRAGYERRELHRPEDAARLVATLIAAGTAANGRVVDIDAEEVAEEVAQE